MTAQSNVINSIRQLKPVLPLTSVTKLDSVYGLSPVSGLTPVTGLNGYSSKLHVYKHPWKTVDSYADILVGGPYGTVELRNTLEDNGFTWAKDLPLINKVLGTYAYTKNAFIDPFKERGFLDGGKIALLNLMNNASETMDLFSNLVKSQQYLAGGEEGLETLANAWGVGDANTRVTYNYNTGYFIADVALEMLSDPLNVISWGASAIETSATHGIKGLSKEVLEKNIKNQADNISKELFKDVSKESIDDFTTVASRHIANNVITNSSTDVSFASLKPFLKHKTIVEFDDFSKALLEQAKKSNVTETLLKQSLRQTAAESDNLLRVYNAALNVKGVAQTFDKALSKLAYAPIMPLKLLGTKAAKHLFNRFSNVIAETYTEYVQVKGEKDVQKIMDILSEAVFTEHQSTLNNLIKQNTYLLQKLGLSVSDLQKEYLKMLRTMSVEELNNITAEELRAKFIKWLSTNVGEYVAHIPLEDFQKAKAMEFLSELSVGPLALRNYELQILQNQEVKRIATVMKHLQASESIVDKLNLLDKKILVYNGKQYGIEHLPEFIRKIVMNSNQIPYQQRELLSHLIADLGINKKNYKEIATVLNSNIKNKDKVVIDIIKQTQDSKQFFDEKTLKKFLQASNNFNNTKESALVNKFFEKDIKEIYNNNYGVLQKNQIKNVKDAVTHLKNNTDLKKAETYLKDVLRKEQYTNVSTLKQRYKTWEFKITETSHERLDHLVMINNTKQTVEYVAKTDKLIKQLTDGTAKPKDIIDWYQQLNSNIKAVNDAYDELSRLDLSDKPVLHDLHKFLRETKEYYKILSSENLTSDLVNYIDDIQDLMQVQLSYRGMYDVINQHINLSNNQNVRRTMNALMNPNSIMRTQVIPSYIKACKDANLLINANIMEQTIAQIDMFTSLQKVLNANLLIDGLTNKQERFIKNLIFDSIKNNGGHTIQEILDVNNQKIINDMVRNVMSNLHHIDVAPELQPSIRRRVQKILQDYIQDISKISLDDFPIYSMYSTETVKNIKFITNNFQQIVTSLDVPAQRYGDFEVLMRYMQQLADSTQQSVDEIAARDAGIISYIKSKDATQAAYENAVAKNLYAASVASEVYATKHIIDKNAERVFNINRDMFFGTNAEYLIVNNRLGDLYKHHVITEQMQEMINNPTRMLEIKKALIQTYENSNMLFAMQNAGQYFNSLDNTQLYYWYVFTKGSASKHNSRVFLNNLYAIKRELMRDINIRTTTDFNAMLEQIVSDKDYIPDYAFDSAINAMEHTQFTELSHYIDVSFMSCPKSVEELGEYKYQIAEYIKNNIDAKNNILNRINKLEDYLYTFGNDAMNVDMYVQRHAALAVSVAELTPTELAKYIDVNTPGGLIFYNNNIIKHVAADGTEYWTGLDNVFNFTDEEMHKVGLKKYVKDDLIFIRPVGETLKADTINYKRFNFDHTAQQSEITQLLKDYRDFLNLEDADVPLEYTTVEGLSESLWTSVTQDESLKDFWGDLEEQKLYQKFDRKGNNLFFNKSYSRINYAIVGGYNALDYVQQLYQAPNEDIVLHSNRLTKNTMSGMLSYLTRHNRTTKYLSLFFNGQFSLDSTLFKDMFSGASDADIDRFFSEGNYKAAILVNDLKGNPKVIEYKVYDRASWNRAMKNKAILLPDSVYRAVKQTINKRPLDYTAWSIYKRIVMPTYKSFDLFTAGFPVRNAIDSLGYKNINELGLEKAIQYDYTAIKMLQFHSEVQKKVFKLTNNATFNKEALFEVLKNYSKQEQECYFLIDLFVNSPASGGYSKAMQEFLEEYNENGAMKIWEEIYNQRLLHGEYSPLTLVNNLNNNIEQSARLGLFLGLLDQGYVPNDAIKQVVKTHFDYSVRPTLMEFCEKVFWFSTFPIYNACYYLTDGLTKNTILLKTLLDAQTASWNNGEYTYEELKKTNFLAYHAITGNIRIGNHIFKISPSVFDMLGLVMDPGNALLDRLNPFLKIPVNEMLGKEQDFASLNPINPQITNYNKFIEGNPIPSLISNIEDRTYIPYLYGGRRYNNDLKLHWTRFPKIKRNPNLMKRYTSKYYARKYRWWHNRGLLSSLNLNQFGTNLLDPEYLTKVKILRAMRSFNHQKNYIKTVRP